MALLDLLDELILAAEVSTEADFEEDEGTILAVEGDGVRGGIDWHSSGVDALAAIKLCRSSCGRTHAGMYRGAAAPSSSHVSASPCVRIVFVSIYTSTRRFLCSVGGNPPGASHSVSCDDDGVRSFCVGMGGGC